MGIDCRYCRFHKKTPLSRLTREELEFMKKFRLAAIVDPAPTILMQGSNSPNLYRAFGGMGFANKVAGHMRTDKSSISFSRVFPWATGRYLGRKWGISI